MSATANCEGVAPTEQVYNGAVPGHEVKILGRDERETRNEIARLKRGKSRRKHDGRKII